MKKAKVLVPALSVLCLSAIAAVSSTVAWFTAVNSATFSTSNFKIQALEGSMTTTITAGVGTEKTTDGNIQPKSGNNLTHGSFDPSVKKVWTLDTILSGQNNNVYKQVGGNNSFDPSNTEKFKDDAYLCEGQIGLYHIMSWNVTFTYDFGTNAQAKALNVYFDGSANASTASASPAIKTDGIDAARGFRMAFLGSQWMVWSPFQKQQMVITDSTEATGPSSAYVSDGAGTAASTAYTVDPYLHYKGETIDRISSSEGGTSYKGYLGTLTPVETEVTTGGQTVNKYIGTLDVTVVVWFEGLDPNVVNDTQIDSVISTTSSFYVRTAATETPA